MEYNLNDQVVVKLTKEVAAHITKVLAPFSQRSYSEGDTYKCQLWSLMGDFGEMINLGAPVPFIDCKLEITK